MILPPTEHGSDLFPEGWGDLFHEPQGSTSAPVVTTHDAFDEWHGRIANHSIRPIILITDQDGPHSVFQNAELAITISLGPTYCQLKPNGVDQLSNLLREKNIYSKTITEQARDYLPGMHFPYEAFTMKFSQQPPDSVLTGIADIISDVSNWGRYTYPIPVNQSVEELYPNEVPAQAPHDDAPGLEGNVLAYKQTPPKNASPPDIQEVPMVSPKDCLDAPVSVPSGVIINRSAISDINTDDISELTGDITNTLAELTYLDSICHGENITTQFLQENLEIDIASSTLQTILNLLAEYGYIEHRHANKWSVPEELKKKALREKAKD